MNLTFSPEPTSDPGHTGQRTFAKPLGSSHRLTKTWGTGAAPGAAAAANPCNVVSMWHLNSVYAANLLAASSDGAVRVWRNHTFRTQRLSTAWQV